MVSVVVAVVSAIIAAAAAAVAFFFIGVSHRRRVAEAKIGSAEAEAKRLVNDAIRSAEQRRKEVILEAKDEIFKMRSESDKELRDRRSEVQRQERRLTQKEENLDRKLEQFEQEENRQKKRGETLETRLAEAEQLKAEQMETLQRISGFTREQAKDVLLEKVDEELSREKAVKINAYEQQLADESEQLARNMLSIAIARCAADHSSESTVSVVALPNDEMKGRIIGREGRNIRAIETATGADLIIDDTPEAIAISCFDPVRREIARVTLEKLIQDGRIHPARIEDCLEKAKKEVDTRIRKEGERVVLEVGVHGLHPDLIKILGRLHYRTSYGQNVLNHSEEVALLSGLLASELGLDPSVAKRAGLLHDIGKALDHEFEGTHIQLGVEIAKRYKESAEVIHAIEAHHNDVEPRTIIACLVQAADAISAARPGARRENLENYIKRLEQLETITGSHPGVDKAFAIQAGREVRVMVKPEQVNEDQMVILARDLAK
ncbi:MAG: ribonuclease Y, partial [Oscillospiraceae bacterium]|nr:ribonuclease Y [Oscillospiraceae bacterium]